MACLAPPDKAQVAQSLAAADQLLVEPGGADDRRLPLEHVIAAKNG